MLAALIPALALLWLGWSAVSLLSNYRLAKASGLPVVVSPVAPRNVLWFVFQGVLLPLVQKLPFGLSQHFKFCRRSWNFFDRYESHLKHGKVFAHVTPAEVEIFVADAAANSELLMRKKDFHKPMAMVDMVNVYGQNVASTDGAEWNRHRRISATPFNERNNRIVWAESMRQANQMVEHFKTDYGARGADTVGEDAMTLTLHVLSYAGLGFSYDFRGTANEEKQAGRARSYRDCLAHVLENFLVMMFLPRRVFALPWLPRKLQLFLDCKNELKRYMVDMVERTRYEGSEHANLLSVLVQKNEEARQMSSKGGGGGDENGSANGSVARPSQGLSEDELYGNIFVYSFAGHETTAHALAYAMFHLAAFPDAQEWVAEEVKEVFGDAETPDELQYDELFPRLKRCLSVVYETLRLYPPILGIPKTTSYPQRLAVTTKNPATGVEQRVVATVPPRVIVFPNVVGVHAHPDYWGPDSASWQPRRWISAPASTAPPPSSLKDRLEAEAMVAPAKGSFMPWGDGPRVCPGRKFSQVELVAVVAAMVRRHRIEVVPEGKETAAQARARVLDVMGDVSEGVTLFMREPGRVRLRMVKR